LTESAILVSYADWTPRLIGFPATVESTTLIGPEKVASGASLQNVATGCQEGRGGQRRRSGSFSNSLWEVFVVKLRLRERESIQEAVRRFRKLVEHSGIKKEMRRREFYEKPSDKRRRARRRAERRARMARMPITG
jgi:small subunit ribosomal protein S21